MNIESQKNHVRELALKVSQRALSKENALIIKRWNDVNSLVKPDRAPIWCRPVTAWKEILPKSSIYCTEPFLKDMEIKFKKMLFKISVNDDTPIYNYYDIDTVWSFTPRNKYGIDIKKHESDIGGGAWGYKPAINTIKDLDKLIIPQIDVNEIKTKENLEKSYDVLGDILPVKILSELPSTLTLGFTAAELIGLQALMLDTIVEPELLHKLMSYVRDRTIYLLKRVEEIDKITPNARDGMYQCERFGPTGIDHKYTLKNCWGIANSQEFDQVSPAHWEEFCLNYQKPIFSLFGYVSYGCCENLTRKIDQVLTIPNLRIIVCSAWTDLDLMIEKVKKNHVIMWRQKASDILYPNDTSKIKEDLLLNCMKLKDSYYQIIFREIETMFGHTQRLHEWTKYAQEAAWKYS